MYASPFHPSSTQSYPKESISSPPAALSSFSHPITSCLPYRSRKVKCDRRQPQCLRGEYACSYVLKPQSPGLASESGRVTKLSSAPKISSSTLARINPGLQRLGGFIARAKAYEAPEHSPSSLDSFTPAQSTPAPHNASPPRPRSQEDALILDNGVPHFISGKHWAWMAAEVCSLLFLKLVLMPRQSAPRHPIGYCRISEFPPEQALEDVIWDADSPIANGATFWPDTREDYYLLLNVSLANVDPIHRIVHRPSLGRRFDKFVRTHYLLENDHTPIVTGTSSNMIFHPTNMDPFEPLAMSIFYAAVNSMKDTDMVTAFGTNRSHLLNRYRTGTEVHLKRQKFMTSRSFEVLQAFVIFLTAQYREDDLGKVWPLTGLAIRMATVHGLHRDPLALPLGTMDVIQVELRRRLWAQICYLDFRAAEDHGFAPSIHGSDFDTRRPVSLDDVDLVEGVAPSYYGRIIQVTHASQKGLRTNPRGVGEAEALTELQGLFNTAETIASEFEKDLDDLIRHCDKRNWCTIASSKACEPFQWHIFSHAGFYLILYVLSELRSPGFQSPEWADLRQRGLQLANAIYEIRGQHTTGAWPAIIWLVNRIRFQQGLGSSIASHQPTGTSLFENNSPMSKESFPAAPPGSAVIGLETTDFMGLVNLEEFDFADFASLGPMGCHGLPQ
ncbi:hypothetical protein N7449_004421 [Penicillium cf. viridicatum]|uniref:Xylanolytic transcriptional activator regulatory domain-containing protein n=1 Tax=Penicillium cf. viridicatum TaxID=2972119 RepID=A0A9W9MJI8_9EURO|nr:hypothetical protein N7449_004421 [Penicillium cf. viridicatum]